MIDLKHSNKDSPSLGVEWQTMSERQRLEELQGAISKFGSGKEVTVTSVNAVGHISLVSNDVMSAKERGTFFLDLEAYLKEKVDGGLTVWHDPIGDKSSLRNLRGIEVKS